MVENDLAILDCSVKANVMNNTEIQRMEGDGGGGGSGGRRGPSGHRSS